MNDDELKIRLQHAVRAKGSAPPDFDAVWDAAEAQATRRAPRRAPWYAIAAGIGAIAVVTIFSMSQFSGSPNAPQTADWRLEIDDSLLNTTVWSAPSDTLLPEAEPDIFSTIPAIFESTDTEVDALL